MTVIHMTRILTIWLHGYELQFISSLLRALWFNDAAVATTDASEVQRSS